MPGVRLECSFDGDRERLMSSGQLVFDYLAAATVKALRLKDGPSGVGMKCIFAPGINVARVEVYAEVSEDKTPAPQDMGLWLAELKKAWKLMRTDPKFVRIYDIVNGSIGFWPGLRMGAVYEELPANTDNR